MKTISKIISKVMLAIALLLTTITGFAQIKNEKTETIKIYGNCEMCKARIEKAGKLKKVSVVKWDKATDMATLKYDSTKTNSDEILKRISLAGYDSERFTAPDEKYLKLPDCCHYDRKAKASKNKGNGMKMETGYDEHLSGNTQNIHQFNAILERYFFVKDALVKSDAKTTAMEATNLLKSIQAIESKNLSTEEQSIWKKVKMDLAVYTGKIVENNDLTIQRENFSLLSGTIYRLAKGSKMNVPVYYQHCPMYNKGKGANWLSKEEAIKNPYYGSQMLTCGKVQEVLK